METLVTNVNYTNVIQSQELHNVVVDEKQATVVVTGMMPPPAISSITNSIDVDLTQLQDGGVLVYNSQTQQWTATNLFQKQIFEAGQY